MKRFHWFTLLVLPLALTVVVPAGAEKPADASDAFFKGSDIPQLSIELGEKDLATLKAEPRKYVRATLKEGDKVVYKDVGIHLKGAAGSFRGFDDKPGLTLNMDKYGVEQTFHGMDKFHLANSVQDPSYLSELICGEIYRAAGLPASRVGHAVVTLQGKRRGLYYIKEGYDRTFLDRFFQNHKGNFYDGGFLRDVDQPLQLVSGKDDVKDRADLKSLTTAAREPNAQQRFEKLEKILDMDKFITYLVLQTVTWDWDGYPMNRNNYRIYHDPKRDKLIFIPSGMDQMFANPGGPVVPGFQGMVAKAVMETPEGKKRYLARMAEIMQNVFKPDDLIKRLDELEQRVQPVLAGIDANAGRDYKNQVNRLRNAIKQRAASIDDQMKKLPK
ncbi:MAG: CotH kinase family protein [Gemmataceae bacterium]|nr:CotH kinase family protein [Gemmataceae bacterium]